MTQDWAGGGEHDAAWLGGGSGVRGTRAGTSDAQPAERVVVRRRRSGGDTAWQEEAQTRGRRMALGGCRRGDFDSVLGRWQRARRGSVAASTARLSGSSGVQGARAGQRWHCRRSERWCGGGAQEAAWRGRRRRAPEGVGWGSGW